MFLDIQVILEATEAMELPVLAVILDILEQMELQELAVILDIVEWESADIRAILELMAEKGIRDIADIQVQEFLVILDIVELELVAIPVTQETVPVAIQAILVKKEILVRVAASQAIQVILEPVLAVTPDIQGRVDIRDIVVLEFQDIRDIVVLELAVIRVTQETAQVVILVIPEIALAVIQATREPMGMWELLDIQDIADQEFLVIQAILDTVVIQE